MSTLQFYDAHSRPLQLGKRLGGGGEGDVFDVVGSPNQVAKKYLKSTSALLSRKLQVMAGMAQDAILKVAAWPVTTLYERPGGPVVGLVMRKVSQLSFREIHFLYSMASRRIHYPQVDWKFLLTVAYNCAAAFDELHQRGVVIGDVNQSNLLVSEQAQIVFIDCDSFQIQVAGQTFPCEVGVDLFTPPELQGRSFRGVTRTPNHDLFGLAVLIFHLLFMGRHPFAGRYLGAGDLQIDRAISEYRFAYGSRAQASQMAPPPHALTLAAVPGTVASLFERAFGAGSAAVGARPTAVEWCTALKGLLGNLKTCTNEGGHLYPASLSACSWCQLMQQGGPNCFITVIRLPAGVSPLGQPFVLLGVWARIEQIGRPQFSYQRPPITAFPPKPWPGNLLQAVPPRPVRPGILSSTPAQPPSRIAAPAIQPVSIPRSGPQRTAGLITLTCGAAASFLLCVALMFAVLGAVTMRGKQTARAPVAMAVFGCLLGAPGVAWGGWWLMLERKRREQEDEANQEYKVARAAYRKALKEEQQEWQSRVAALRERAQREYKHQSQEWDQSVQAMKNEAQRRRRAHQQDETALLDQEREVQTALGRITRAFDDARATLEQARARYQNLDGEYQRDRLKLQARARELQLQAFLDQHLIEDAQIDLIGSTRKAVLASFGIETALDVQEQAIMNVPGFKAGLTRKLLEWRRSVEQSFLFNPATGVPAHEQHALDQKYRQKRDPLEKSLTAGPAQLQDVASRGNAEVQHLRGLINQKVTALAQSLADLRVVPANL